MAQQGKIIEKIEINWEKDLCFFKKNKDQPISGLLNQKQCITDVFHALKDISNKKEYTISEFYQIKEATLKALQDLWMCW
jgi:hypothetical protein